MPMPDKYPEWASTVVVDGVSGQPNRSDPDSSDPTKKARGWDFKEFPPRQWFNYLHNLVDEWSRYFNEDLWGNTLGNDNRIIQVQAINSYDAVDPSVFVTATEDIDLYAFNDVNIQAADQIDIDATNNLTINGGDIWIDSGNFLYLDGLYEIDITAGEYILMSAGDTIDLGAPSVTSPGVIHAQGASAGLRVNSGKVMTEYREGSFIAPVITGSGGFTPDSTWTWRWIRQDNIIDLIIPGMSGNVTSTAASWVFVGVPSDIIDGYSLNIQSYERSSAQSITYVPLHAGVNAYSVELTQFGGLNPDTINFTFNQLLQAGAQNIGKMHFRYEVRD